MSNLKPPNTGGFFIDNTAKIYKVMAKHAPMEIDPFAGVVYILLLMLITYPIRVLIVIRTEVNRNQNTFDDIDYLVDKNEPRFKPLPKRIRKKMMRWIIEQFHLPKNPSEK